MHRQHIRRNHLYKQRRIRGLRQKQLARLLGYRSTSMISRFESGTAFPSLTTAILLELALGVRIAEIYINLTDQLKAQIIKRAATMPEHISRPIRGRLLGED